MASSPCPLCLSEETSHFHYQDKYKRDFYLCSVCDLRFVDREQLLSITKEEARYSTHQNSIRTPGYEKFLRRLIDPVAKHYSLSAKGLDFGSGPYPMLIELMNEDGFKYIDSFDPIFTKDSTYLSKKYDFITMCEVIEHINEPNVSLREVISLLNLNGRLIISTGVFNNALDFHNWHYINDDTHINIFSYKTFEWISEEFRVELEHIENDLIIFLKK